MIAVLPAILIIPPTVVLFATTKAKPVASTPTPVMFRFAILAVPSTLNPSAPDAFVVVLAARITPETVKLFCMVADEPVPVT